MIVSVIGKTSRLVPIIQSIKGVKDVLYSLDGNSDGAIVDVVVLDHIPLHSLEQHNELMSSKMIYIYGVRSGLGQDFEQAKEVCQLNEVTFLVDRSDMQIQEELDKVIFPDRHSEIIQPSIAVLGGHRWSGASSISKGIAEIIAEKTSAHVGLVKFDPYDVKAKHDGIHQLYREYEAGSLTSTRIKGLAEKLGERLFYINGNPRIESARQFNINKLEQVIGLVQHAFDFTIFDVSPYWDNTLTLVPLRLIKRKYIVATSNEDMMSELYSYAPQLLHQFRIDFNQFSFIYNHDGIGNEKRGDVGSKLQAPHVFSLPHVPNAKMLESKFIKKNLERFAEKVIQDFHLPLIQVDEGRKSWKSVFAFKG